MSRVVVALAGRRIDPADAVEPRFPIANVELVKERLCKSLKDSAPEALVCAAACGVDLLALAAARELGIRCRVVLSGPKEDFRSGSVVDRPGEWGTLFDTIVKDVESKGDLVVLGSGSNDDAYRAANRAILDQAQAIAEDCEAWIVWNGAPRDESDITLHFADEAWARGLAVRELLTTSGAEQREKPKLEFRRTCFVAMPFGSKAVGGKPVHFDAIYSTLLAPAIARVELPEGGRLVPYRTDRDPSTGVIDDAMFRCLEYSRFVLADITGLNPNVCIELGVRFRSRHSGMALFRQPGTELPFDISHVKVFDYDTTSPAASRDAIATVLGESLQQNQVDSPVFRSLSRSRPAGVDDFLKDAENALRNLDVATARAKYAEAAELSVDDSTIWVRLAALERDCGNWAEALAAATRATELDPDYGEAWRERGVAENQLWRKARDSKLPDGIDSLRRATLLSPKDFDAFASLGGALRRQNAWEEALEMYRRSLAVSNNHPYPLLNVLKLEARVEGRLQLERQRVALARAALIRRQHTTSVPPYDKPWCFFDLIEIYLYQGQRAEALKLLQDAVIWCDDSAKLQSFRDSLALLRDGGIELDGLSDVLSALDAELSAINGASGLTGPNPAGAG